MESRGKRGGTLALIVTCVLFIIILGIGAFFLIQMIGGAREHSHATDAGNLNVAKQALKFPSFSPTMYSDPVTGQQVDQNVEYAGLLDTTSAGPNQIDLAVYNRLVGKAFIVACNASAEGPTPSGSNFANAQAILDSVEGPGGTGQQLCQSLQSGSNTQNFFNALAFGNSLRMLNWNQPSAQAVDTNPSNYTNFEVSFLRQNQGAPTNLQLVNTGSAASPQINVIPPGAQVSSNYSATSSNSSNTNLYLSGYTPITVQEGSKALTIYGVPLRPGLEPHTVSQAQFTAEHTSPSVAGGQSLIPPNAFQSQWSVSQMANSALLAARASALVGCLTIQAPASIPQGYIVINNSGPNLSDAFSSGPVNVFAGELMGNGVYIMTAAPSGDAFFSKDSSAFGAISSLTPTGQTDSNGNPLVNASALPAGVLTPDPTQMPAQQRQLDVDSLYNQLVNQHGGPINCNNLNSFGMSNAVQTQPQSPPCNTAVGKIQSELLQAGGGQSGNYSGLMAIEYIKAQIIAVRGAANSLAGDGCGTINGAPPCTGLKQYLQAPAFNQLPPATNSIPFGSDGTIATLLAESGDSNNSFYNQIVQRLYEMNPKAKQSDITAAMNLTVPFQAASSPVLQYLYWNGNAYVISTSPPQGAGANPNITPDGNAQNETYNVPTPANDILVDVALDGGYPHPFDCEGGDCNVNNQAIWTPSSGRGNLLGVIQFKNCANTGSTWCCPC
jgi:hypothetical protein